LLENITPLHELVVHRFYH